MQIRTIQSWVTASLWGVSSSGKNFLLQTGQERESKLPPALSNQIFSSVTLIPTLWDLCLLTMETRWDPVNSVLAQLCPRGLGGVNSSDLCFLLCKFGLSLVRSPDLPKLENKQGAHSREGPQHCGRDAGSIWDGLRRSWKHWIWRSLGLFQLLDFFDLKTKKPQKNQNQKQKNNYSRWE